MDWTSRRRFLSFALLLCHLITLLSSADAGEFHDDLEREFSLRKHGELRLTNLRGSVIVQGWSQDRVKVRAKRTAITESEDEARKLFEALDVRFSPSGDDIELSAEYGKGLDIEARLRERKQPRTRMDLVVTAPAGLRLRVWTIDGQVTVRGWNADLDVRTGSGNISIEAMKSGSLMALCPGCEIQVSSVRGSVRCMGGSGAVTLKDVEGGQVYVESGSGTQNLSMVEGEQLYVSKSGSITGRRLVGRVEFHTGSGGVDIQESEGFLSGRTDTGNIVAEMRKWRFADKALFESSRGSVSVSLPPSFAGEVDLWSVLGKVRSDFPVQRPMHDRQVAGPDSLNRVRGLVAGGGEQLRVVTYSGDIQLKRGI